MPRFFTIIVSCLLALAAMTTVLWKSMGRQTLRMGRELHRHAPAVHHLGFPARRGESLVVWLGDSTLMPTPDHEPSFASLMQDRHQGRVTHVQLATPGLDPFHYYYLMGPATDQKPDVVVLLANISQWRDVVDFEHHMPLLRFIPSEELLGASLLPFAHRRVRLPQLLLMRTLESRLAMNGYLFAEGLRWKFEDAFWRGPLGGPDLAPARLSQQHAIQADLEPLEVKASAALRDYDQPLDPDRAMVKIFRAAVEMGVRRGAKVLVVVSPIPHQRLAMQDWYDADEFATRIERLRGTIEDAGGHFLDLHRAMPESGFRDFMGHYNRHGMERMREAIEPTLEALLDRSAESDDDPMPSAR